MIQSYYYRRLWMVWSQYLCGVFLVAPPAFFLMQSIEGTNVASEAIREEIVEAISHERDTFEASKLVLLNEWRPIEFTLLGLRLSGGDVVTGIITIFAVWGMCLLGFDWLV